MRLTNIPLELGAFYDVSSSLFDCSQETKETFMFFFVSVGFVLYFSARFEKRPAAFSYP